MRINVYSQELLLDGSRAVEHVQQEADTGVVYSAVRLFLHSSERLHDRLGDDDRSAITIWLPRSEKKRQILSDLLHQMAYAVDAAPPETGLD